MRSHSHPDSKIVSWCDRLQNRFDHRQNHFNRRQNRFDHRQNHFNRRQNRFNRRQNRFNRRQIVLSSSKSF
ncbi:MULTISPECIES: hypothetical protein [unclassified Tolypothrix]|uniref:hypothetical protein n=1 Tax=unclassified Tolypothrix TaxID=2649714 RepID=UPI00187EB6A0|nr:MULTISPECIES: hypothetical protein [unclassified Tolypothrix]MBE9081642.1 hypothetical protein [Tolypothrix sp. LEGE 11397]UYD32218.1 hypothetical protein HG267_24535 [Tolypothrix sp. PCC 7601]